MKVQYMSDIHLDHSYIEPPAIVGDVCVVAGDLSSKGNGAEWLNKIARQCEAVIFVPGNHDYWGCDIYNFKFNSELLENVHVLLGASVTISGVLFVGATLWTDFNRSNFLTMFTASQRMNDYVFMNASPADILDIHNKELEVIKQINTSLPKVVVTHHAPSFKSIPEEFVNDPLNGCYASDLDRLIDSVWIHGHIHEELDYAIGDGVVKCNPRGYKGEIKVRYFEILN